MILHYIIVIKFKKDNVSAVLIDKIGYYDLNRCTKIKFVKKDDIIYFDPPYDIDTEENTFSTYTKEGFNQKNQKELRDLSLKLISIGAKVLISNSNTKYINELYSGKEFKILKDLTYVRTVGSNSAFRKRVNDVLIIGSENN